MQHDLFGDISDIHTDTVPERSSFCHGGRRYFMEKTRTTLGYSIWEEGVSYEDILNHVQIRIGPARLNPETLEAIAEVWTRLGDGEWTNEGPYVLVPL